MIYLINQESTTLYKIGRTKNIKQRVKQLQTGCPLPIVLVFQFEVDKEIEAKLESALHRRYKYCKSKGEWFDFVNVNIEKVREDVIILYEAIKNSLFLK